MTPTKGNEPEETVFKFDSHCDTHYFVMPALTKREWLAGIAMQGMCANNDVSIAMSEAGMRPVQVRYSFAQSAVAMADALLAELEKTK